MQATSLRRRLLYSSGVVNYALKDAAFGVFVLFYYKQVLGLSGTLTGAFLINATLKRLQVLEAITVTNDVFEKVFMFLLGTLVMPLFGSVGTEAVVIASFALSLTAFRMTVKYLYSRWWASHAMLDSETTLDLWIGLVGQGILASAAVMLQVKPLSSPTTRNSRSDTP